MHALLIKVLKNGPYSITFHWNDTQIGQPYNYMLHYFLVAKAYQVIFRILLILLQYQQNHSNPFMLISIYFKILCQLLIVFYYLDSISLGMSFSNITHDSHGKCDNCDKHDNSANMTNVTYFINVTNVIKVRENTIMIN